MRTIAECVYSYTAVILTYTELTVDVLIKQTAYSSRKN